MKKGNPRVDDKSLTLEKETKTKQNKQQCQQRPHSTKWLIVYSGIVKM